MIEFGVYDGKPIKWRILKNDIDSVYVLSEEGLCSKKFTEHYSNDWNNSDLRKWLNGKFYSDSFNDDEKSKIIRSNDDLITLLSKEEAEKLMFYGARFFGDNWWLRSTYQEKDGKISAWYVTEQGYIYHWHSDRNYYVRPALKLSLN